MHAKGPLPYLLARTCQALPIPPTASPFPHPQLGFRTFVVPAAANVHASGRLKGARIVECRTVVEAFRAVLGSASRAS